MIATGYYVAGFAGRSGGCQNGIFFSLISAGMCLRHIQGRAAHCSRSFGARLGCSFKAGCQNGQLLLRLKIIYRDAGITADGATECFILKLFSIKRMGGK